MKRKHSFKSIIAIALCVIIAITAASPLTASAATKKTPVKVTFKGKTVNIVTDVDTMKMPKIKTLKSKLGKKPTVYKQSEYKASKNKYVWVNRYAWVKGDSSINVIENPDKKGYAKSIEIIANDKNAAIFGIKVGMTKDQALGKLDAKLGNKYEIADEVMDGSLYINIGKKEYAMFICVDENNVIYSISLHL